MENQKSNTLIVEFMGFNIDGKFAYIEDEGSPLEENMLISDMKYDTSWDWLMPVVEKIEDMGSEIVITNAECTISAPNGYYEETIGKKRLGTTHTAVVEFIKQYNK